MAHAYDPDALDPEIRLLRKSDEAWRTDLALIRELTRQERQAEEDRAYAARLAGVTLDELPESTRNMAMLLNDYDDDDDDDNGGDDEDDENVVDDIDHEDEKIIIPLSMTSNPSNTHVTTSVQKISRP